MFLGVYFISMLFPVLFMERDYDFDYDETWFCSLFEHSPDTLDSSFGCKHRMTKKQNGANIRKPTKVDKSSISFLYTQGGVPCRPSNTHRNFLTVGPSLGLRRLPVVSKFPSFQNSMQGMTEEAHIGIRSVSFDVCGMRCNSSSAGCLPFSFEHGSLIRNWFSLNVAVKLIKTCFSRLKFLAFDPPLQNVLSGCRVGKIFADSHSLKKESYTVEYYKEFQSGSNFTDLVPKRCSEFWNS